MLYCSLPTPPDHPGRHFISPARIPFGFMCTMHPLLHPTRSAGQRCISTPTWVPLWVVSPFTDIPRTPLCTLFFHPGPSVAVCMVATCPPVCWCQRRAVRALQCEDSVQAMPKVAETVTEAPGWLGAVGALLGGTCTAAVCGATLHNKGGLPQQLPRLERMRVREGAQLLQCAMCGLETRGTCGGSNGSME